MTDVAVSGLGCDFPVSSISPGGSASLLDADGEYAGCTFRFPKSGTLTYVSFATSTITTGATLNARIETVNQANGQPSGTLYDANATGTIAIAAADDSVVKHCQINGATGISVVKGDEACFFVTVQAGSGFNGSIYFQTGIATRYPYAFDYLGGVFSLRSAKPMIGFVIDGAYYTPVGCEAPGGSRSVIWGSDHNPDRVGCAFSCPVEFRGIGLALAIDLDANATFYLFDSDGTTVLESQTFDSDLRGATSQGIFYFMFGTARTFKKGTTYYFAVLPSDATHLSIGNLLTALNGTLNPFSGGHAGINFYKATCNGAPTGTGDWTVDVLTLMPVNIIVDRISYPSGGSSLIML